MSNNPNRESSSTEDQPKPSDAVKVAKIVAGALILCVLILVLAFRPTASLLWLVVASFLVLVFGPNHWFGHRKE